MANIGRCFPLLVALLLTVASATCAQRFSLETKGDSLSYLVLTTDSTTDRHRLPFPVYRFCTGDVDGDGNIDAMVGVVKTTRFDPVMAKRIFIFKNHRGRIRALWMGSRLGGILEDFLFSADGHVVSLQSTTDGRYAVLEHEWRKFGLGALRFLARGVARDEALACFGKALESPAAAAADSKDGAAAADSKDGAATADSKDAAATADSQAPGYQKE